MRLGDLARRWFGLKDLFIIRTPTGLVAEDGTSQTLSPYLPRTSYDYAADVQQGLDSNVVMAPVFWIMRNFTEAQARVQSRTKQVWAWVEDHPAEMLIERPNEAYDGDALWQATVVSYVLNGNAYWLKDRNVFGDVLRLWYVPHWLVEPKFPQDGSQFISHYEYRPGGQVFKISPRDIVHFRFGLDPRNPRLGMSPLRPLLREVFTDDEAANFTAKLLDNMGIPGVVVSPKDSTALPSPEDVATLKAYMASAFRGDHKGESLVMGKPTDIHQFGFDPQQLTLSALRDIAEERVCSVLGLPAAIVGFGSGLQSTKVGATMRELRRLAWIQCLTPMQKRLARDLTWQLLPDFVAQTRRFRYRFDTEDVAAFQEEADLRAVMVTRQVMAGTLRVDRAQEAMGLEVDETQKVYLRPSNSVPIGEDGKPVPGATPAGAVTPAPEMGDDNAANRAPAKPVDDPEEEEETKMLAAIALRRGYITGNGHHTTE